MKYPIIDNVEELRGLYPKSFELFTQFIKKKLEGMEEIEESDMTKLIDQVVGVDCRKLYDFFDENNIVISVSYYSEQMFTYTNSKQSFSNTRPTRAEAEVEAFKDAFKTLEELCP